ncbi:hypothetical protein JYU34_018554 [Plutella xylostella]|uniref:Protein hairless n=1 Tax=Plutella xylostella TaxID=51655 RepID=A0ABQ7PY57_PLUXY|nr:hypothetical protein JYU34_018554 [Plutella xylostella]
MHIQEGTNTTLTTCTKMTEEVDRRHGVNGNSGSKGGEEPAPSAAAPGGRLKFFKDGKFILELVRGAAREGERAGWVSVPRKTFWPPPAAPPAPTAHPPRAERAASLSVSDDNSSIQSSPWQRDHCWKQASPRRNISKELTFFYCRPSTLHSRLIDAGSRRRRRRPLLAPDAVNGRRAPNGDAHNGDDVDVVDAPGDDDREKYYHMKLKKPQQYHKQRVYKKTRAAVRPARLATALERLAARAPAPAPAPAPPVHHALASCRQEHALVSPRKRILRELERVSLEDASGKRRARPPPPAAPPRPPAPGPSRERAGKHVSPYSIHSLLSPDAPRRAPLRPVPRREELFYPLYRAPAPLYYYPPGAWPPLQHPLLDHRLPKDEPSSDLPLNLSKH